MDAAALRRFLNKHTDEQGGIRGLTSKEAAERLAHYGPNDPAPIERAHWPDLLLRQVRSAIIIVLTLAMVASLALQEWLNAIAIGISIVASVGLGFAQEFRSERAIAALHELTALRADAIRDDLREEVSALDLVPGDLIVVDEGDTVPADALVLESHGLLVDESVLTGEAIAAEKEVRPPEEAGPLGWPGAVSAGTTVVAGTGWALVYATGAATALGGIFSSVGAGKRRETPLERRLESLGRSLVVLFLVLTAALALLGIAQGRDIQETAEMAVALAIGAVPEGLPAVATTALAVAVRRLASHRVLVRQLDAVETLGSTTVIVSDKTGTLTENRLIVRGVVLPSGEWQPFPEQQPVHDTETPDRAAIPRGWEEPARVIIAGALCGEAVVEYDEESGWHAHGDPSEAAISYAAAALGWHTEELQQVFPRVETTPFSAARRYMRTVHEGPDGSFVAVKGAPAAVRDLAGGASEELMARSRALGEQGYRMLAVATGPSDDRLEVIGAIVLEDPLRHDAPQAIADARAAGLHIMLATGDQLTTAANIGRQAGLLDGHGQAFEAKNVDPDHLEDVIVIARATHDQKQEIIAGLHRRGEVVAMLGDGVNDAPALTAADVGVAVGPNATDVAVQASQVILADGRLNSLVEGIREGRQTAQNLRLAIIYLLTASFATIGIITIGIGLNRDLPLGALQILWLNLVVHVFAALALATGREDQTTSSQPTTTLIAGATWVEIALRSLVVAAATAVVFLWSDAQDHSLELSQAFVFATAGVTLLGQAFLIGVPHPRLLLPRLRRPELWAAIAASLAFLLVALYLPFLRDALDLHALDLGEWAIVLITAFIAGNITQLASFLPRAE